jgi:hypothetical protein
MMYTTQNYWGFELCPSSGILGDTKHSISETGCFPSQMRGEIATLLGSLERTNFNHMTTPVRFTTVFNCLRPD